MRLVCPNCEAKYEVPDDAIPDTGRDVQCTNCGHTWFQMRGRTGAFVPPVPAEPAAVPAQQVEEPAPEPAPEPAAEVEVAESEPTADATPAEVASPAIRADEKTSAEGAEPEGPSVSAAEVEAAAAEAEVDQDAAVLPEVSPPIAEVDAASAAEGPQGAGLETADDLTADATGPATTEPAPDPVASVVADAIAGADDASKGPAVAAAAMSAPAADAPVSTYAVDESVLAILREEAEREANARRAEVLESQTDLGIDSAMPRKGASLAEMDTKPSARRDLLPDVEEINSTLRPSEMQADADGTPDFVALPPQAPRGFRSGFLSLMTVAILGAALYLAAPRLAVAVPALAGPLETYVSLIDSMRLGLDGMMRSATVAISDS